MSFLDILLRISLATIIGGAIGYEREFKNRPAGFRTHILVCIGATIVSLIQITMVEDIIIKVNGNPEIAQLYKIDYGRLGAQVISGVGFLGAGTILHTKNSIKGLTTAASLWVVACLGLSIGLGYYQISLVGALFIELTLWALKIFQKKFITKIELRKIEVYCNNKKESMKFIENVFDYYRIKIKSIELIKSEDLNINQQYVIIYTLNIPYAVLLNDVITELSFGNDILKVIH